MNVFLILFFGTLGSVFSQSVFAPNGCPRNWVLLGESCYRYFSGLHTDYDTARQVCESANSRVLTINSKVEEDFVAGHYSHREELIWLDAENSSYDNWDDKVAKSGEDCAAIRFQSKEKSVWIHAKCNYPYDVVCKVARKQEKESFCEFVREVDEKYNCYVEPTASPTTSESVTTESQTMETTTQSITSTFPSFSSTLSPNECERGWSKFGEKCYKFFYGDDVNNRNFYQSQRNCTRQNADLVTISSEEENAFVLEISNGCDCYIWIGAVVVGFDPLKLLWLDGSETSFDKFKNGKIYENDPLYYGVRMGSVSWSSWQNDIPTTTGTRGWVCAKLA